MNLQRLFLFIIFIIIIIRSCRFPCDHVDHQVQIKVTDSLFLYEIYEIGQPEPDKRENQFKFMLETKLS